MIAEALRKVIDRRDLARDECMRAMSEVLDGTATPAQTGAFLALLRAKGETHEELVAAALALRARAPNVRVRAPVFVDTCGTGGDGRGTFNVSTAAAIVVAAAGVVVAKHGNRAVSSRCGSADVLSALGVRVDLDPERVERCIERVGIGFLLAPRLHASLGHVAPIRRELGTRTVFNLLGPLVSPARPTRQVIGVFDAALVPVVARALVELGCEHALVVHGAGTDEISIAAPTVACEVRGQSVRDRALTPASFGISASSDDALLGGDPVHNASLLRAVLGGERGPRRDAVVVAASAALYVADRARDLEEGARLASRVIDGGLAAAKLAALAEETR